MRTAEEHGSTQRRPSLLTRWLSSRPPAAAIEITPAQVSGVVIADRGRARALSSYARAGLGAGVVEPALNAPNVHQAAALSATIKSVLDQLTPRPRRVALVVPDIVAKVSLLRFDNIPPKPQDLEQLIRWQVRKALPFKIEDAQIAWVPGIVPADGGREYIITAARRDVIESYERASEAAGAQAGIVDIASLNLINGVLAAPGGVTSGDRSTISGSSRVESRGDWLLVHVGPGYGTLAVVRGGDLIFFRNRTTSADDDLADLVHQTTMYHEDRLGGGRFARVVLAGASSRGVEPAERLRRDLEERIGGPVETLDFRGAVPLRDRIAVGPDLIDSLAPAIGVLLRERVA